MTKNNKKTVEIRNRKASYDYFVGETFEAGIKLTGTELKAIRAGKAQINDSFVRFDRYIPTLYNSHINEYEFGNLNNHIPTRPRLLLLNKKEIIKLKTLSDTSDVSIIPLKLYFKKALVKVLIAVCKGKKLYDKRESVKKNEALKDAKRAMSLKNFS